MLLKQVFIMISFSPGRRFIKTPSLPGENNNSFSYGEEG